MVDGMGEDTFVMRMDMAHVSCLSLSVIEFAEKSGIWLATKGYSSIFVDMLHVAVPTNPGLVDIYLQLLIDC